MVKHWIVFTVFALVGLFVSFSDIRAVNDNNVGFGFSIGGQRAYCDYLNTDLSPSCDLYLKHVLNDRFFLITALGYGSLSSMGESNKTAFSTNMLILDIKISLLLSLDKIVKPYVTLGLSFFGYDCDRTIAHEFSKSVLIGGGLEYMLKPKWGINGLADYRMTDTDLLDNIKGGEKDGYLNVRVGVTRYFKSQFKESVKEKKEEKIDIVQLKPIIKKRLFESLADSLLKTNTYKVNFQIAHNYFSKYKYETALDIFKALAKDNVENDYRVGYCYHWVGECYFGMKKYRDALNAFQKASQYKKSFRGASLYMVGRCYLKFGMDNAALESFQKVVSECPESNLVDKAKECINKLSSDIE